MKSYRFQPNLVDFIQCMPYLVTALIWCIVTLFQQQINGSSLAVVSCALVFDQYIHIHQYQSSFMFQFVIKTTDSDGNASDIYPYPIDKNCDSKMYIRLDKPKHTPA